MSKIKDTYRIHGGSRFCGTASLYAATANDHMWSISDYHLETMEETRLEETRAFRLAQKKEGRPVARLRKDQLAHELVILFGPEMTANEAVAALERVANDIRENGLMIGRDEDAEYLAETYGAKPAVVGV